MKKGKTQLISGDAYREALHLAKKSFKNRSLEDIQKALGGPELSISFLGKEYILNHQLGELLSSSGSTPLEVEIIILRYLSISNGSKPTGKWVAFRELSGGTAYVKTFSERAEERLLACIEASPGEFQKIGKSLGGEPGGLGEAPETANFQAKCQYYTIQVHQVILALKNLLQLGR